MVDMGITLDCSSSVTEGKSRVKCKEKLLPVYQYTTTAIQSSLNKPDRSREMLQEIFILDIISIDGQMLKRGKGVLGRVQP